MTSELKAYLEAKVGIIEKEDYDALVKRCPLTLRKELILLLLKCSDNSTTIITPDRTTRILEDGVRFYLPDISLVYTWIKVDKWNPDNIRRGTIDYVAVINGNIVNDSFRYKLNVDHYDIDILAEYCSKDFADNIKEHLND